MLMKMAAASTTSLLLLWCFAISSTDSQDPCNYNAVKGKDFIVPLSLKLEPSHRLKWKHNDNLIFDRRQGNTLVQGKMEDVSKNGSLKLTNLNDGHKGTYTPELYDQSGKLIENLKSIHLCIFEPAPKPKVTKNCSVADVKFTCEVPAKLAKDLKYAWLQNDILLKENTNTLKRKAEEVEKGSFRCKVSNPASSETSDAITQESCYKRKSIFPETLLGISTWIYVGAGGGIVLVLIIVVIICCIHAKRKKRMLLKEEGELRLQWTNEQQHPHHHHHHHHQQHQHSHPPEPHHHRGQQHPAGHTGPRQHRSKQHREQQLPRVPPEPSSRRLPQAPKAVDQIDDEQPPPLPQPRKKAAKTQRV
ncbi:T-cell surface antigen CD2 isoform X2 [Etheostoma cragini]|nr:T-cell surface antigen CD2 isoform X2 [Etheostoma cragini]